MSSPIPVLDLADMRFSPTAWRTFLMLEGAGRWTAGDEVVEPRPNQMLVVPPETPHGFRNTGEEPLAGGLGARGRSRRSDLPRARTGVVDVTKVLERPTRPTRAG